MQSGSHCIDGILPRLPLKKTFNATENQHQVT